MEERYLNPYNNRVALIAEALTEGGISDRFNKLKYGRLIQTVTFTVIEMIFFGLQIITKQ